MTMQGERKVLLLVFYLLVEKSIKPIIVEAKLSEKLAPRVSAR